MDQRKKAVFNWSGGKDSALALYKILQDKKYHIIALLTTINKETSTYSIHAIPVSLLKKQADSIGIPLYLVALSKATKNYEEGMREAVMHFKNLGVTHFIFGDIFLSDVKKYREDKLAPLGIKVVEPLWGKTSHEVMAEFLESGIKTKIIVTQADQLNKTYVGKEITQAFVKTLPKGVDICGENGEFHTFSYNGPLFKYKIEFTISKIKRITYAFQLDDGNLKNEDYWQAILQY